MTPETIALVLRLIDMIATVAIRSVAVRTRFNTLRNEIEAMVAADRGPTPEEWTALNERADVLHRELQGLD